MSLEYNSRVYYQAQFVSGRDVVQYLQVEDPDLLQEEPPLVKLRAVSEGMVIKDMTEERAIENCLVAFGPKGSRKGGVVDYVFKHIEQIEAKLLAIIRGEDGDQKRSTGTEQRDAEASVPANVIR